MIGERSWFFNIFLAEDDKTDTILYSVREDSMKDKKTEDSQRIISIEKYKKKRTASQKTATGDVLQTTPKKRGDTASILVFKQKHKVVPDQKEYPVSLEGLEKNIIYMNNYLKSGGDLSGKNTSPNPSRTPIENNTSDGRVFEDGNIVMMDEYLKRKTSEHPESIDWERTMAPPSSGFHKLTAAVAVAVLAIFVFQYVSHDKRELAGEKDIVRVEGNFLGDKQSNQRELLGDRGEAQRGLQSLPAGASSSSVNQLGSAIISAGRKPTQEEKLNGY